MFIRKEEIIIKAFKALGDETRREILKLLNEEDMSAGEIASHFKMSKPAISKHLSILKEAELITCEKNGQFLIYSINISVIQEVMAYFLNFLDKK